MTSRRDIIAAQISWATENNLAPDSRGYLSEVENNLFRPLSDAALTAFNQGSGSELVDTPRRPAKMKALHSSSALAVNVFDYWSGIDAEPLAKVLGLSDMITAVEFEAQYPTGLPGNPPNLDVVLHVTSGKPLAIESKFTEWMQSKPAGKAPFKDKYFERAAGEWSQRGLPACQQLAEQMQRGDLNFRYLDAPQLLKHALGLATRLGDQFSLGYLYFDVTGAAAESHREETARFAAAVDDSLGFFARSYQELFDALRVTIDGGHPAYLEYLSQRYFGGK